MKIFFKFFGQALPLALGLVFSLLSVAFTVNVTHGSSGEDEIIGALFFGIIGYPLLIAGALSLIKKNREM